MRDNKRELREGELRLVGRDTETGVLVRYDVQAPDWSALAGPDEFTHWLEHKPELRATIDHDHPYPAAKDEGFAILWKGSFRRAGYIFSVEVGGVESCFVELPVHGRHRAARLRSRVRGDSSL